MSESIQEQIEYGSYCKPHGTPLGTPGGADLMCGLCESGLTEWVDDPMYGLAFTYGDIDEWATTQQAERSRVHWHISDDPEAAWTLIHTEVLDMKRLIDEGRDDGALTDAQAREFTSNCRWQAVELRAGYWTEPTN